jgi:hypothetical protein
VGGRDSDGCWRERRRGFSKVAILRKRLQGNREGARDIVPTQSPSSRAEPQKINWVGLAITVPVLEHTAAEFE